MVNFHIGPIVRSLLQRKLTVFLMVMQLAIVTAIFSAFADQLNFVRGITKIESGIAEEKIFAIAARPIQSTLTYDKVQHDLNAIKQLPFVEGASAMRWSPISQYGDNIRVRKEVGREAPETWVMTAETTAEAMDTLELPIIAGRNFTYSDMVFIKDGDAKGAALIIVTNHLAEKFFGSANQAVGKFLYEGDQVREIIGVCQDWWGFGRSWDGERELTIFRPQHNDAREEYRYIVRVKDNNVRNAVIEQATTIVRKHHNDNVLLWVEKLDESRAGIDAPDVTYAWMMLAILIVVGVVVAFAVGAQTLFSITQRFKQFGIRRALGASQQDIIVYIQTENMIICFLGLLIGFPLSILVGHVILIVAGGTPVPLWCILLSCAVLTAICFLSAHIPLKRMADISPSTATRSV